MTSSADIGAARAGRGYAYAPKVREQEFVARRIRDLLDRGHNRDAILQGFVNELSREEEQALRDLLASDDSDR